MRRLVPLLLIAPLTGVAAPLDDAVALVRVAHPTLAAQRQAFRTVRNQPDWSADLTLGWTEKGTVEGGARGANAGIRVTIPLAGGESDQETAQARTQLARGRERVMARFLDAARDLRLQAAEVDGLEERRSFERDRLEYFKKRVDEGLADAPELWPVADAVRIAEAEYREARAELRAMLTHTARRFGGERWKQLRALLAAHAKPTKR